MALILLRELRQGRVRWSWRWLLSLPAAAVLVFALTWAYVAAFRPDVDPALCLIKAIQVSLALVSASLLLAYRGPFLDQFLHHLRRGIWLSLLWPPLVAIAMLISSWSYTISYVFMAMQPVAQPALPLPVRIICLVLILTALTGRWAEADPERLGRRFGAATAGGAAIFALVVLFLPASPQSVPSPVPNLAQSSGCRS